MQNNLKLFTATLIIITLLSLSVLSATDTNDDTSTPTIESQSLPQKAIHEQNTNDDITHESKASKTNKKSTKTTDVKNYNELVGALNQAVNDTDHTEYVINLNNGTYTSTVNYDYDYWPNATNDVNIIINANNQSIKTVATQSTQALGVQVNEKYNLTINNLKIEGKLTFYGNTTIQNSIINETITNYGTLYIDNNTVIGKNARINGNGKIVINDMDRIINKLSFLNGTYTIVNKSVGVIENHGNITLINCTLSSVKENTINNYGNITLINSKILQNTSTFYVNNYNESNMKLINSSAVFTMYNYGVLVISDDSTIENGSYFLTNDNGDNKQHQ